MTEIQLPPQDPNRPRVVPEIAIAERMILEANRAFMHLAADVNEFRSSLNAARSMWAWTFDLKAGIAFWDCCRAAGRDPEDLREIMLSRLDQDLRKMITGKAGFVCPVCSRMKVK